MNKNNTNNTDNTDNKNSKLPSKPLKKDVNNDENSQGMPAEGACSAEFQQGCISMDDQLND